MCVAGKTVIILRDSFVCCLLERIIDHLLWVVLFTLFLLKSRSKKFSLWVTELTRFKIAIKS